ncbi:hypothetical protein K440DRAFT_621749 [Wilcoxina mikolae CBS 423.85]|nr:hypothetical protein K440DRAFT_621749 [Wilcoxina mikolae CBS 423.85]
MIAASNTGGRKRGADGERSPSPAVKRRHREVDPPHTLRGSVPSTSHTVGPGPKCFRISNVPPTWNEQDLLVYLESLDCSLVGLATSNTRLSLYPACFGSCKVALLNMTDCPEYFQSLSQNEYHSVRQADSDLVIDSHFYDLTPLNTPEGDIVADVVAVMGLAGHAFGSWRNRTPGQCSKRARPTRGLSGRLWQARPGR